MILIGQSHREEVIILPWKRMSFNPVQKRMLEDDNFFDVTSEDVAKLLNRMTFLRCSREDVIRMRIKYDLWLNDRESQLMAELGLDYENHIIGKQPAEYGLSFSQQEFTINGYRVPEWKMLTDDDFIPSTRQLNLARERLAKIGDSAALELLDMKYKFIFDNH